jgi:hypothetical protein
VLKSKRRKLRHPSRSSFSSLMWRRTHSWKIPNKHSKLQTKPKRAKHQETFASGAKSNASRREIICKPSDKYIFHPTTLLDSQALLPYQKSLMCSVTCRMLFLSIAMSQCSLKRRFTRQFLENPYPVYCCSLANDSSLCRKPYISFSPESLKISLFHRFPVFF